MRELRFDVLRHYSNSTENQIKRMRERIAFLEELEEALKETMKILELYKYEKP